MGQKECFRFLAAADFYKLSPYRHLLVLIIRLLIVGSGAALETRTRRSFKATFSWMLEE